MTASIALLLGRPPSPTSVLHGVLEILERRGVEASVTAVADGDVPETVWQADLRLLKDLSPCALRALQAGPAAPTVDDAGAVLRCGDKAAVTQALRERGIPVPATRIADHWSEVRELAGSGDVVVKPRFGTLGHGVLLLGAGAPEAPPSGGPWLVQQRIPGDGMDRKLYVVGDHVDGVRRRWPAPADRAGRRFEPSAELADVARAAAGALQLELCGVDVLVSSDGPVVVDVNPFPGFKGVPGAAERIAGHLVRRVAQLREVSTCGS